MFKKVFIFPYFFLFITIIGKVIAFNVDDKYSIIIAYNFEELNIRILCNKTQIYIIIFAKYNRVLK